MEKGKKIEAEFQLPEAIIQHIQSFMNGKQAARTTILSKSWYAAWSTCPNLDFDQDDFLKISDYDAEITSNNFWKYVNKIMQRYERLNLKIDSLRLRLYGSYGCKHPRYDLVNKLIVKALELGATCLDFKNNYKIREFVLPYEVFESENLIRLSLRGCAIGTGLGGNVRCWRLKSLSLAQVYVEGNIIWDIISSCPLIENLSIDTLDYQLSQFPVLGQQNVVRDVGWPILKHEFHNLKSMSLYGVDFHPLYFDDFSSKFPCLKNLTLDRCDNVEVLQISSPSLEYINLTQDESLREKFDGEFDVPNLRKFTFSGPKIPLLAFTKVTNTWESHICISYKYFPRTDKWFLKLNKLLKILSPSKISLTLDSEYKYDYEATIEGLPKPEVENLTIDGPFAVCPAIFYNLFQCCRPIYITQYWSCEMADCERDNDFMEFVYERMAQQVILTCCVAYQRKSGECDLEDVSVEFYDESVSAWRPQLLDTLSSIKADEQKVRLHLRWRR